MILKPCRLCGSDPVVKVRDYNVCYNHLTSYYVICSFCGNESKSYPSMLEAINDWNEQNGQVKRCA
ncbi:MAG: Lar family restriction alleviation protein, partial [Synergistaceae bacterium]|nr:Lar family restriction alleviation protein [Synergistaceae bacterium]